MSMAQSRGQIPINKVSPGGERIDLAQKSISLSITSEEPQSEAA